MFSLSYDLNLNDSFYLELFDCGFIYSIIYPARWRDLNIDIRVYIGMMSRVKYACWNYYKKISYFWLLITSRPMRSLLPVYTNRTGKVCRNDHENILSAQKLSFYLYLPLFPSYSDSFFQFYINSGKIFITSNTVYRADHYEHTNYEQSLNGYNPKSIMESLIQYINGGCVGYYLFRMILIQKF